MGKGKLFICLNFSIIQSFRQEGIFDYIFFLFLIEAIDSSDEGSKHVFMQNLKKIILNYHQILRLI